MRVHIRVQVSVLIKWARIVCWGVLVFSLVLHLVLSWLAMVLACIDWQMLQECSESFPDLEDAMLDSEEELSCVKRALHVSAVLEALSKMRGPGQWAKNSPLDYFVAQQRTEELFTEFNDPSAGYRTWFAEGGVSARDSLAQVVAGMHTTKLSLIAVSLTMGAIVLLQIIKVCLGSLPC